MREKELKFLGVDHEEVERKLEDLGAEKVLDGEVHDIHFDTEDGKLGGSDQVLRLRRMDDEIVLTWKGEADLREVKDREEVEVQVSDADKMEEILKKLGFRKKYEKVKHRTSYRLDSVRVELDNYTGRLGYIPEFVEIEGEGPEAIRECAKKLNINEEGKPWSTDDLVEYYKGADTK